MALAWSQQRDATGMRTVSGRWYCAGSGRGTQTPPPRGWDSDLGDWGIGEQFLTLPSESESLELLLESEELPWPCCVECDIEAESPLTAPHRWAGSLTMPEP